MKRIFINSFKSWLAHDPFTQSGAAAYYAVFALPGLLILIMGLAALFMSEAAVEREVLNHINRILGGDVARVIDGIVDETQSGDRGSWAAIIGVPALLFGATGLFVQLQRALNHIWEVRVKKSAPLVEFLKQRATALGVIMAIGFLLLVSLAITTALTLLIEWLAAQMPIAFLHLVYISNIILSFLTVTVLFALIYRVLPDAEVGWACSLRGGALASALFLTGEYLLTWYFEITEPGTAFGAAGSVILLMIWISYSCLVLLLGAEFAKAYAEETTGLKARPTNIAKKKIAEA